MEGEPRMDPRDLIPKVEREPKQPSQGEKKAQELLSHIPELDAEENAKLTQAFARHLEMKFSDPTQRQRILEAKVTTPKEAQELWNIVSEGPKADFAQKMVKFTVDRTELGPKKYEEHSPITGASDVEIANALMSLNISKPKETIEMTSEELARGLSNIDTNLEEKFYMIDKNVPMEQKNEVIDQTFDVWRDILKQVPDATLFASSAMYLWGKRMKERGEKDEEIPKDFKEPPGDLDAFVKDRQSLTKIRDILSKIPGVQFDNDAQFKPYADGTIALSGYMPIKVNVGGREQVYNHDFEFFTSGTNRILEGTTDKTDEVNGIKVLSLEGLKKQYLNNLAFEGRVKRETQNVTDYLTSIGERGLTPEESEKLGLSNEEVAEFRKLQEEFWDVIRSSKYSASKISESMDKLLSGGLKEKIAKRLRNVEAIAGKREGQATTTPEPLAPSA